MYIHIEKTKLPNVVSTYFIKNYLKTFLIKVLQAELDDERLNLLNNYYKINCEKVLELAILTMIYSETPDAYILKLDTTIMYGTWKLSNLIYNITYGTRTMKGYPILLELFNKVTNNIDKIYYRWEEYGY